MSESPVLTEIDQRIARVLDNHAAPITAWGIRNVLWAAGLTVAERHDGAGPLATLIAKLRQDVITGGGIVEITEAELERLIAAIPTPLPTDCPEQSRSTP